MEIASLGFIIALTAVVLAYLIARAVAVAYFRTKREYTRSILKEHDTNDHKG